MVLLRELNERLTGIDASSTRSTREEFLLSVNEAYWIAIQTEEALSASPPRITLAKHGKQTREHTI